ncbi:MAG: helix-turn-helix domain-containing protein [Candidatus Nanoarchaeia archaeon]|nr:hypothetical protein [Candidatus Haiyanarchaeum thermophilum]MCW1302951.1 hypothetical protein [Candidatus Haiyanarchaeum thermophilum]MCW1303629.1 hypothetical protein [Candidatus Haiyanarchaeum thermophilum]MCW1306310.1 hypothetical protein [Candidatus Haiyanarchaeum thermophilum]MCW1307180.1 hypothetical protein [Candidatus Haiyanarchaeum thermophilum]
MVVSEDLLARLRKIFDLNLYEVKIWTALLSKGVSTAGELSEISGVPRSRTYDILESLERKGFVIMKLGKPTKFIAVPPSEVIERFKKVVMEEAERKLQLIDKIRETEVFQELNKLYEKGEEYVKAEEISAMLRGSLNVYSQLSDLMKKAQKKIYIVSSEEGIIRKVEKLLPVLQKVRNKGIKIKVAFPITEKNREVVEELKKAAEVKNLKDVNARFCVIDGKYVVFFPTPDTVSPNFETAILVNSEHLGKALDYMFENLWEQLKKS